MGMTRGHGVAAIVIGTIQLLLAVALIIVSFVFASYGTMNKSQTPYWGGFPFLVSGIFGIAAGITKNQCCMVTFLVLNILMTIVTAAASIILTLALSLWNVAVNTTGCYTMDNTCVCDDGQTTVTYDVNKCSYLDDIVVIVIVVMIICYCCAALALAGSILGCAATCCAPPFIGLAMTSLHCVGFLAHAMNRRNLLVFVEAPATVTLHKIHLNKILKERNLHDPPMMIIAQPTMGAPGVMVSHSSNQVIGGGPVSYPQGAYAGQAMFGQQTAVTHDKAPLVV